MGCIESLEEKYHEIEERFKQIFEADKFFVENMQFVSLCHAYKQESILADFQFMSPDKITKSSLRNFMNQVRQIDFVLIARIYIERLKFPNENILSLEQYNDVNDKFGLVDALDPNSVRFFAVKQQLVKQYQEFLEVERQNAKLEKLKNNFRELINKINLSILYYNNLTDEQKLQKSKEFLATATKPFAWQEYRSRQISAYFQGQYKKDIESFKLDEKHTVHDEQEFIRKFNEFEREDSVKVEESYKKQCRFHRLLCRNVNNLQAIEYKGKGSNTVVQKDIRYMSLTQDAYFNYAKYLEENMAKLLEVYTNEYDQYIKTVRKEDLEAAKQKRIADDKALQLRREKEQNQSQAEQKQKLEALKSQTDADKKAEIQAKIEAQKKKDEAKKIEDERRAKMKPEERKAEDDKLAAEQKAADEKKKREENDIQLKKVEASQTVDLASQINDTLCDKSKVDNFLWYVKSRNDNKVIGLHDIEKQRENTEILSEPLKYWNKGLKTIAKGRVALVLLAGDSDLKWHYEDEKTPFGFRPTGLNSQKCLFQLFCERVEAVQRLAHMYRPDRTMFLENSRVHVYVMTNPDNDFRTRKLFRKHHNFGLWKANIHFFEQPQFPALEKETGRIKLRDRLRLHMMPDGTGGFYDAVLNDKLLADWDFWGIKYLHVMGIDNLLGRPVDPTLIGMLKGIDGETPLEFVTKAVRVNENDKLSRLVMTTEQVDSEQVKTVRVIRADDIKDGIKDHQLGVYNDFACNLEFVKKVLDNKKKWETFHETTQVLPFYQTPKNHQSEQVYFNKDDISKDGQKSLVFERDIYDPVLLVPHKRFGVLEISPENEYAPIKPVQGKSFSDAVIQLSEVHTRWLLNHGYQFEKVDIGTKDTRLDKKVRMDQEQFKIFVGEKTMQERQRELKLKADCKAKLAKNKKLKKINELLESSDEEDESQIKELSHYLVEIDARQSIHGESIPAPPIYQVKEKSKEQEEEELPQIRKFKDQDLSQDQEGKETYPFYLKCQERPIKLKLPWGLNEIYRYI